MFFHTNTSSTDKPESHTLLWEMSVSCYKSQKPLRIILLWCRITLYSYTATQISKTSPEVTNYEIALLETIWKAGATESDL